MDEDTKTLLTIVALLYGSSNGLGLLKEALNTVNERRKALHDIVKDKGAEFSQIRKRRKHLLAALFWPIVLVYVAMVILVPLFLWFVVQYGTKCALSLLGLGVPNSPSVQGGSLFYWVLLLLSLVTSYHYLSPYFQGWITLLTPWKGVKPRE